MSQMLSSVTVIPSTLDGQLSVTIESSHEKVL
jgi:hypothetical protein